MGIYRRNLITFRELSIFYTFVIFYYLLDSFLILMLYISQDSMTNHQVFLIYHSSCIVFDCICLIILPTHILIKTLSELPEIWTSFRPVKYKFYMSGIVVSPRREGGGGGPSRAVPEGGAGRFMFVLRDKEGRDGHSEIQIEMPHVVD